MHYLAYQKNLHAYIKNVFFFQLFSENYLKMYLFVSPPPSDPPASSHKDVPWLVMFAEILIFLFLSLHQYSTATPSRSIWSPVSFAQSWPCTDSFLRFHFRIGRKKKVCSKSVSAKMWMVMINISPWIQIRAHIIWCSCEIYHILRMVRLKPVEKRPSSDDVCFPVRGLSWYWLNTGLDTSLNIMWDL